jgi:hypothetical protein
MDNDFENYTQDEPQLSAEQQEQLRQHATQQLALGQSLIDSDDQVDALSALTEAAYLLIGLRDETASDALSSLVSYIQGLGEEIFDTATQQLDDQHREMLDGIIALLRQMDDDGDESQEQPGSAAEISPEVKNELTTRAAQQLAEGKDAASNEEFAPALNSLVEAAAIYVALDDERKEEALAAFVSLLQGIAPDQLNQLASQLDEQHQRWMMGIMSLLQQRTVQEHAPEIRAAALETLSQAEQARSDGDNVKALGLYSEAYSNSASLQDGELATEILSGFGAMADDIGPGALADASVQLDERGKMAFQMLLGALAELRDPSQM